MISTFLKINYELGYSRELRTLYELCETVQNSDLNKNFAIPNSSDGHENQNYLQLLRIDSTGFRTPNCANIRNEVLIN